jgi:hypothetical protein
MMKAPWWLKMELIQPATIKMTIRKIAYPYFYVLGLWKAINGN